MKSSISAKEKAKNLESMLVTLDSLTGIGFKLQGSKYVSSKGSAGESYEILLNGANDISVEFTFYPAFNDKSDYIVVYVIDNKTDKDFSLDAWMQKQNSPSQESPFKLSNYDGEFKQQLREFIEFVNSLFKESGLRDVLEGKAWIDVEFNWGGIK